MAFLIFLFGLRAEAMSADAVFVRKLNRAHSTAEIRNLQTEFEDLKIARRACRLQMQSRWIPSACFEALHRESRWGLSSNAKELKAKLDSLCEEAARELRAPLGSVDERSLSVSCRESLRAARRIESYRNGELVRDLN
jgi:hypothetical protein